MNPTGHEVETDERRGGALSGTTFGDVDTVAPVWGGPVPAGWGTDDRLRGLFEQSPVPMSVIELATRTVRANRAYLALFGYDADDAPPMDATRLTHPADSAETARLFEALVRQRIDRVDLDKRYLRADGSTFWGHLDATLLREEDGRPWAILTVCRDITDRLEAVRALTESESRFRALVQHNNDAIVVLDDHARITYASPSAARLVGYSVTDRVGEDALSVVHPDDVEVVAREFLAATVEPGRSVTLRHRLVQADGSVRHVESTASNHLDDPAVDGIVVNIRDITDRQDIQTALEISEHRFRRMLENISDTVTLLGADGKVIATTGAERGALGHSARLLFERSIMELVHPDDLESAQDVFSRILDRPGVPVSGEFRMKAHDGRFLLIEASAVNLLDDPAVEAIVVTTRDVSDRRRAERELAAARDAAVRELQRRTEFVASVSHELRTPIHGVLGLCELLTTAEGLDPSERRLAASIEKAARGLQYVLDDLLDYTRIESGRLELGAEPLDTVELLEELVALHAPAAERRGVPVRLEVADDVPAKVVGDGLRVRQIVGNLLSNAVKFTAEGEVVVHVDVRPANMHDDSPPNVRVAVHDTGIGVAADAIDQLFEPFSQAHVSTARDYGGTGLGLTVARRLAEQMGGRIEVSSTVGEGSTFTAVLPLPSAEVDPVTGVEPTSTVAPLERHGRVLVVEDNSVSRLLIEHQLTRLGYEPVMATSGVEALELFHPLHVDAVLMDCQMPGLDGYETTRRMRSHQPAGDGAGRCPIIALTANVLPEERARCLRAGMDDVVAKPVGLEQLDQLLRRWAPLADPAAQDAVDASDPRQHEHVAATAVTFDRAVADQLADEVAQPEVVRAVVGAYLRELPLRVGQLEYSLQEGDRATLGRVAHTLGSTSRTVGALRMAELGAGLEEAAGAIGVGDDHLTLCVAELVDEAPATRGALEAWIGRL
ncbi:MAG: PAS domain S-box protein [Acidimicrobiia bacterium]|nr:PAS domain S-box protein [Acidimicrobiia bacterium]